MSKIEKFIAAALKYKGDKYSQPKRLEKGYSDCSSLIQKALNDIGLNARPKVTVTTHRMGIEGDSRFRQVPMSDLRRGDILWGGTYKGGKWVGHVALYLGDGKTLEALPKTGVAYNVNRSYFKRVYRVVALEEKAKPIENVPIVINGKACKVKGYIVDGTTYIDVKRKAVAVRAAFEALGADVDWKDGKVIISL